MMSLLAYAFISLYTFIHPFYVSMTDIYYNAKVKELEISVRIFTDDFEATLKKNHNTEIDILHPTDKEQMDEYVNAYLQKHLQIIVDDTPVQMEYLGYEEQNESIWTYFQVENISPVGKMAIVNSLLHDYTNGQINMIHVNVNGKEQTTKLDFPETNASFSFH